MTLPKANAVILTALDLESEEVMKHLSYVGEIVHPAGTRYKIGIFQSERLTWSVAVTINGKRNVSTAVATERAIQYFAPDVVIFVGCAGARQDCKFGDIVGATRVFDYEAGAEMAGGFQGADQGGPIPFLVEQQLIGLGNCWRERAFLPEGFDPSKGKFILQPVASGEKTQKGAVSAGLDQIAIASRETVAVDTESLGFFTAARMNGHTCAFVVRGISDGLVDKNAAQDLTQQPIATALAAAVAFEFLAQRIPSIELAGEVASKAQGTKEIFDLISEKFEVPQPPVAEPQEVHGSLALDFGAFADGGFFAEAIAQKASGRGSERVQDKILCEIATLLQKAGEVQKAWRLLLEILSRASQSSQSPKLRAHIYSVALKLLSQRADKIGAQRVVGNFQNVLGWIAISQSKGKAASVYSRAGIAYAVLGRLDESVACFLEARQQAAQEGNEHQAVTVNVLWAIANKFRSVEFEKRDALQTIIDAQLHYLTYSVDPSLGQAFPLKSAVQCLFAEAAILLYGDEPDNGRLRLAAASVMRRRAFAHPAAEGFAELLALIPDVETRNLVRRSMDPTEDVSSIPELASYFKGCAPLIELFSFGSQEWIKLRSFLDS